MRAFYQPSMISDQSVLLSYTHLLQFEISSFNVVDPHDALTLDSVKKTSLNCYLKLPEEEVKRILAYEQSELI